MKKSNYLIMLIFVFSVFVLSCKTRVYTHKFSEEWKYDKNTHWHECKCGEKQSVVEHNQIWKTKKRPTSTETGLRQKICSICGFEFETQDLPVIPKQFILLGAGEFVMGSNQGENRNKPVHEVIITKPFYMGNFEVTQAEYEMYRGNGGGNLNENIGVGDNYPAYNVSWYDALVYCNKRSLEEDLTPCYSINGSPNPDAWGPVPTSSNATWNSVKCDFNVNGYRLPTEAEWEYAARAGDNTVNSNVFSGTKNIDELKDYASYYGADDFLHIVGQKLPNAFDLYDMSGNVGEWCWNWKTMEYDSEKETGEDPVGVNTGYERICRGGHYSGSYEYCLVFYRRGGDPADRVPYIGFRVVRSAVN